MIGIFQSPAGWYNTPEGNENGESANQTNSRAEDMQNPVSRVAEEPPVQTPSQNSVRRTDFTTPAGWHNFLEQCEKTEPVNVTIDYVSLLEDACQTLYLETPIGDLPRQPEHIQRIWYMGQDIHVKKRSQGK